MDKQLLLRQLAEHGYNVGFGAKKHFATYDIVEKAPGWISFISMAVGVFALIYEPLEEKWVSALLTIFGVAVLYINFYEHRKSNYAAAGNQLTQQFNRLRDLYYDVKSSTVADYHAHRAQMQAIMNEFYRDAMPKQIFLSDWYAHYKFFWQHQIEWIDEQKHFRFFRDKVPLSASVFFLILVVTAIAMGAYQFVSC